MLIKEEAKQAHKFWHIVFPSYEAAGLVSQFEGQWDGTGRNKNELQADDSSNVWVSFNHHDKVDSASYFPDIQL